MGQFGKYYSKMTYFLLKDVLTEEEQKELLRRVSTKFGHKTKFLSNVIPEEQTGIEIDLTETNLVNDFKTIVCNQVKKYYGSEYNSNNWWVSISNPTTTVISHKHTDGGLSAVFYLQAEGDCGAFELEDYSEILQPRTGDLLIFPGYCYHKVSENKSNKSRICLVFDLEKANK